MQQGFVGVGAAGFVGVGAAGFVVIGAAGLCRGRCSRAL